MHFYFEIIKATSSERGRLYMKVLIVGAKGQIGKLLVKLIKDGVLIDAIELFPNEIEPYVAFVACNPPASQDICEEFFFGTYLGKESSADLTFGKIESLRAMLRLERQLGINLDRFKP